MGLLSILGAGPSRIAAAVEPNLANNMDRPLRYRPEGGDFVIVDGAETFNRPLYGRNTAFRVDGGDRPEFVLYLPGRGGNLRLGMRVGTRAKWLHEAAHVTTRYRPGELHYEIRDPLLGAGRIELQALALYDTDGLVLRTAYFSAAGSAPRIEMLAAFGGVNGERGRRDGDIGTESVPISQWFQLQAAFCAGNRFTIASNTFELHSTAARIAGAFPAGARLTTADAHRWADLAQLLDSTDTDAPAADSPASGATAPDAQAPDAQQIVVARFAVSKRPSYLALQQVGGGGDGADLSTYRELSTGPADAPRAVRLAPAYLPARLPAVFEAARVRAATIRAQVSVRTPDPYVDAAAAALNVAADAVWDEPQQALMHGAIAWRTRLLGWRGAYALDALGWQERARAYLRYWAGRQNVAPVLAQLPPADEATNLARNPAGLHSNGDLSNSHYDMNTVYIDALFRHLLWTGDRALARELWPVIERHLAWQRRLFRREFGPDKLPLYEACAVIWASDDLQYGGGGVTHASAYNWWHNVMAARVARWLGEDAAPYEREAALIRRAMDEYLWIEEQGMFAEYRDWLGLQRAHPAAALWSFYHVLDAGVLDAGVSDAGVSDAGGLVSETRALRMARYVERQLPRLPVRGPGVGDGYHLYATSSWMPYTWSINNVVMGENTHAALGFWQAGRDDEAFTLFRGALLASMYMGISPGNVGTMTWLDVYRRESQRDFADGAGTMSRALVEGLFGVRPDAIDGVLLVQPGWPAHWSHASLRTPAVEVAFESRGSRDTYRVSAPGAAFRTVRLRLRMKGAEARVRVGRRDVQPEISTDAAGRRWLEVAHEMRGPQKAVVEWIGAAEPTRVAENEAAPPPESAALPRLEITRGTHFDPVPLAARFNDRVTDIFRPGKYRTPRSPFVSLAIPAQGIGAWAGHVNASADIDDSGLRAAAARNAGTFVLPDGVPLATPGEAGAPNIAFVSQWDNYPRSIDVPLSGRARGVVLLMAGSTNHMQSRFDNGEVRVEYTDGTSARLLLRNPTNWWPIDQDYFIDDFQFRRPEPIPPRLDLKTGRVRLEDPRSFAGRGGPIPGGAATVLELRLDETRELRRLEVAALANEVVIGLMAATLLR